MPKGHVQYFTRLYGEIFKDILAYDPSLRLDLVRDMSRIISSCEVMGDRVFLEHLPNLGKHFDACLSSGRLVRSSLPFTKGVKNGSPIPRLFKGIWLRIFSLDGMLKQDIDPNYVLFLRQLLLMGKKTRKECPPSALYETTEAFYVDDVTLPDPNLDWDSSSGYKFDPSRVSLYNDRIADSDQFDLFGDGNGPLDTKLLATIQHVADIVSMSLGLLDFEAFRHGPGAVADRLRGIEKFSFTRWSPRLEEQFPILGNALPLGSDDRSWDEWEIPSRLIAVPKTITGPRLIASEPSDHMFAQFSVMEALVERVRTTYLGKSIDFSSQEPSRQAALLGSLTGSTCTIDMKSASDRISLWLIERFFRKNEPLLRAFRACRTALVDLTIDKKLPKLHRLKKFTTQGSALTFPVQSIVFSTVAYAAGLHVRGLAPSERNVARIAKEVRVFGDDIIVPKDWLETFRTMTSLIYLRVNDTKTHGSGYFRESCGMDAFMGHDVTPAYVREAECRAERSITASVLETSNNFFKKGWWNAARWIESTLPRTIRDNIPVRNVVGCSPCLISFSGNAGTVANKRRWNHELQREEEWRISIKSKIAPLKAGGSLLLQAYLCLNTYRPVEPSYEGIPPWRPYSRWEAIPVIRGGWEPSL